MAVAPEKLLRAIQIQILYSTRSERQLMEQTHYNLLFRWFIGLSMDDAMWVPTVFSKNRERLIEHDAVAVFFNAALQQADKKHWLSKEHFCVDGTLIHTWAGHKSFVRKDDDADGGDFRGRSRSNETRIEPPRHSRLYRKGKTASELRFMGHALMDNRNGLAAQAMMAHAHQVKPEGEIISGADKGHDAAEFIEVLQDMGVTPHVAQNKSGRTSAVPDEIAANAGSAISLKKRKLIKQSFGWGKYIGPIRQVMVRGNKKVDQLFMLTIAAYNLVRMRTLGQVRLGVAPS